jgi:hypothetical protein
MKRKKEKEVQEKVMLDGKVNQFKQKEKNLKEKKEKHEKFLEENKTRLVERLQAVSGKVNFFYILFRLQK